MRVFEAFGQSSLAVKDPFLKSWLVCLFWGGYCFFINNFFLVNNCGLIFVTCLCIEEP